VVDWTNLEALITEAPLESLKRRRPDFCRRYEGKDDEFGFDLSWYAASDPIFRFCYEEYFKVDFRNLENIPGQGRAIVVGNHSGVLPVDGAMMSIGMCNMHSSPRPIRYLITDWFFHLPFFGEWMAKTGQVRGTLENAEKLLAKEELVGIFPEGVRGVGKPFRDRYRLIDFHPGFVKLAIATQSPIVPVATVGGDEIFPNFVNLRQIALFLKFPFFPITPAFPWMPFPFWLMPLPIRWVVNVHKPIDLGYPPERATDRKLVRRLAKEIQYQIQRDLNKLLKERKTVFTGWEPEQPAEE
jgi:1-acyl-sn-glycerol-3-phosphate acyltransferase